MNRKTAEKLFSGALLLIVAGALWMTQGGSYRVYLFPRIIETAVLALLVIHFVMLFVRPATANAAPAPDETSAVERTRVISVLVWMLGFIALIVVLGFPIGGTVAAFAYLRYAARESWRVVIGVTIGVAAFFWISSNPKLMGMPYPAGWIADFLPDWFEIPGWIVNPF